MNGIIDHIMTLSEFPERGTQRRVVHAGLRVLSWRRRVSIAFFVEDRQVLIAGVFYGGRDYDTFLKGE